MVRLLIGGHYGKVLLGGWYVQEYPYTGRFTLVDTYTHTEKTPSGVLERV